MIELIDTLPLMTSDDYKERFLAEYYQVEIRINKLQEMYDNWDNLDFKPTCPKSLYKHQLSAMKTYRNILLGRAEIEDIKIES